MVITKGEQPVEKYEWGDVTLCIFFKKNFLINFLQTY